MIGIVGSRRRGTLYDRKIVFELVDWLYQRDRTLSLVSGGCAACADSFAEEAARLHDPRLVITEFKIDREGVKTGWDFTQRAYGRNRQVAEAADELYALVTLDRTGGTENTIGWMKGLKKPIYLVDGRGRVYLSPDGEYPQCDPVVALLGSSFTG